MYMILEITNAKSKRKNHHEFMLINLSSFKLTIYSLVDIFIEDEF